jgi:hypothetical protein
MQVPISGRPEPEGRVLALTDRHNSVAATTAAFRCVQLLLHVCHQQLHNNDGDLQMSSSLVRQPPHVPIWHHLLPHTAGLVKESRHARLSQFGFTV